MFTTKFIFSIAVVAMTNDNQTKADVPIYHWNNTNVLISSILWTSLPTPALAGYLAKLYGPKWIIILSSIANTLFFLLIPPFAAWFGSTGVLICRLIQGGAQGFFEPQGQVVAGRWVPPEERSTLGFFGMGLTVVTSILCAGCSGFIASSTLGWPWIYYIFGIFNILWILWYMYLGEQNISTHPRITPEERRYIKVTLAISSKQESKATPWKQILTNIHVIAIIVGSAGFSWITVMMSSEMSIFYNNVMGYAIAENALISALPTLFGLLSGVVLALSSDWIIKRGILSVVNARRIYHTVGSIGLSLSVVVLTYIPPEHKTYLVPFLMVVGNIFVMAAGVGGTGVNTLDIAPKTAGIITGLSQVVGNAVGSFAPLTVQWICGEQDHDVVRWRIVFFLGAGIAIVTSIFFVIFASGELQEWEHETEEEAKIEQKTRRASVISATIGVGT